MLQRIGLGFLIIYLLVITISEIQPTGGIVVDPVLTRIRTRAQLRVGYDPGSLPFTTIINNHAAGHDIDLATKFAETLGVEVLFVPTGLDAAYDELQQGHFDMIASAMPYAPEQGWRARFSTVYFDDGLVLLQRQTVPIKRIGVVFGADSDTMLRRMHHEGRAVTPVYGETTAELWQLFACDVVDAVIVEESIAWAMHDYDASIRRVEALSYVPYVLVVPHDAPLLHEALNRFLADADDDGTFVALRQKWLVGAIPRSPVQCSGN
ncbi:MAG: substrate-binding periplasmic protein [Chloroflexota bacterium]|jgi:ABC-type amino acid transport substrate-binding protein